jgi:cation-transporting ATPase 13A3/4/5
MDTAAETDVSVPGNSLHQRNYCIAVTGDVFRWMIDFGHEDVLNRVSRSNVLQFISRLANRHHLSHFRCL